MTKIIIPHINRVAIAALSFVALCLDGLQLSDYLFALSIVYWLWLPEIERLEFWLLKIGWGCNDCCTVFKVAARVALFYLLFWVLLMDLINAHDMIWIPESITWVMGLCVSIFGVILVLIHWLMVHNPAKGESWDIDHE